MLLDHVLFNEMKAIKNSTEAMGLLISSKTEQDNLKTIIVYHVE
jgi:predicted transcriptional regulator